MPSWSAAKERERYQSVKDEYRKDDADTVATIAVIQEDVGIVLSEHVEADENRHLELVAQNGQIMQKLDMMEVNHRHEYESQQRENKRMRTAMKVHRGEPASKVHADEPPSRGQVILHDNRTKGSIVGTVVTVVLVVAGWLGLGGGG